ncbi:MAG TPA: hypothetical protein VJP80_04060 [Candidatus Saccharimonadales bacterium]|nr:hypothetical protein [Candidatus Saccharimonadales bacterium]
MPELRHSPHHVYLPGAQELPGFEDWHRQALVERRDAVHFPSETPLTDHEMQFVDRLETTLVEMGAEADRRTDPAHCHVFDSQRQYVREVGARWGKGATFSRGATVMDGGVVVLREEDPLETCFTIAHELVHDKSQWRVTPKFTAAGPGTDQTVGYMHLSDTGTRTGMTELVTDMTAHRAVIETGLPEPRPQYRLLDIIGTGVVLETAGDAGCSPGELGAMLTDGLWSGDMSGIGAVHEYLGDERFHTLVNLPGYIAPQEALPIAQELDVVTAVEMLEDYRCNTEAPWFSWHTER